MTKNPKWPETLKSGFRSERQLSLNTIETMPRSKRRSQAAKNREAGLHSDVQPSSKQSTGWQLESDDSKYALDSSDSEDDELDFELEKQPPRHREGHSQNDSEDWVHEDEMQLELEMNKMEEMMLQVSLGGLDHLWSIFRLPQRTQKVRWLCRSFVFC